MTLGILGAGQLGRMTALAAIRLGIDVRMLATRRDGPEAPFEAITIGDWEDADVLARWAGGCDAVTVESEWAPADRLCAACPTLPVWPSTETLVTVRHKGRQRTALAAAGVPQPDHVAASTLDAALEAARGFGYPVVAKRFEGSYDGYGNATCRSDGDLHDAWQALAADDGLLVEAFVPFLAEGAVTVARRADGTSVDYPLVRSEHRDHRLHAATVPSGFAPDVLAEARRVGLDAIQAVGAVGVATAEVFVLPDGRVLLNEIAPRPHNTAHLTIDAHHTSQFENHVRAVLGLPLGDAGLRVPAACLVNVLGAHDGPAQPDLSEALAVPGASVHLYGKTTVRTARKMGHVTATAETVDDARTLAEAAAAAIRF